jgi:hypothetical protein
MKLWSLAPRLYLLGWVAAWFIASRRSSPAGIAPLASLLFGTTGIIAGLYLFVRGFQLLQRKRWVEDTPITKISAAALGPLKVLGKACGPYTLLSPLAQADCYYYRAAAWNARNEENEDELEQRAVETIFTPLFVQDETGRLMIDPRGAQLDLPNEYEETIEGESMSECARRFLRRHGLSTAGATTVTECTIKPGDPLLVLGVLGEADPAASGTSAGCGYLSAEAADLQRREQWEAMGIPDREMPASPAPAGGFDLNPRVILDGGPERGPFVLSRQNPQRMIDYLARRSVFDIWGGPVLAVLSLGLALKALGLW